MSNSRRGTWWRNMRTMAVALLMGCGLVLSGLAGCGVATPRRALQAYRPQTREVTITAVPILVREQTSVFPFLKQAFAPGGVLEGREVYEFVPSTVTAIEGDTLHLTVINPEDDLHTLVLPGLSLALPGQQTMRASYVVRTAGIFAFTCNVPSHIPMMWGQLVVLKPEALGTTTR